MIASTSLGKCIGSFSSQSLEGRCSHDSCTCVIGMHHIGDHLGLGFQWLMHINHLDILLSGNLINHGYFFLNICFCDAIVTCTENGAWAADIDLGVT